MLIEATSAGFYTSPVWQQKYPRLQILTIEQLLNGAQVQLPPSSVTFSKAPKAPKDEGKQPKLGI
jgi:site-specific DNA-methyltransferase (adenine-specific)